VSGSPAIRWVLFDLGGVLVRLGGVAEFGALLGVRDDAEFWQHWLACAWVQRFERGACSVEAFARGMVDEFRMGVSPAEFLERLRDWPQCLQPGAEATVDSLRPELGRACLSNCNALHWNERLVGFGLEQLFPRRYLSHEVGLVKPDPAFFRHVIADLGIEPGQALFLDDNAVNVAAAAALGMAAELTRDAVEAREILGRRGLCR
jgi:HAD superfamily hydrolase (TIGR01509 family)